VLVLDGGTGTELRRRGVALDPVAWSGLAALTDFDVLVEIHADFVAAGADVITTNTFGASPFVLAAAGHADDAGAVVSRSVDAALKARDAGGRDVTIAGSISCLPPAFDTGRYPDERAERAAYAELAEGLAAAGVDVLALEMMQETRHAPLACEAARATGLPVWLGLSGRLGAGGELVGFDFPLVPLASCLEALLPFEPTAVLIMHSPIDAVGLALATIRGAWSGLSGAYPEIGDGTEPAAVTPGELARAAREWRQAGATIVGGCCGTTPEHVRAVALELRNA